MADINKYHKNRINTNFIKFCYLVLFCIKVEASRDKFNLNSQIALCILHCPWKCVEFQRSWSVTLRSSCFYSIWYCSMEIISRRQEPWSHSQVIGQRHGFKMVSQLFGESLGDFVPTWPRNNLEGVFGAWRVIVNGGSWWYQIREQPSGSMGDERLQRERRWRISAPRSQ